MQPHGTGPIAIEGDGIGLNYLCLLALLLLILRIYFSKNVFLRARYYLCFSKGNDRNMKNKSETVYRSPLSLSTVSFCVGGIKHEVSCSLVESFPTTMLFKLLYESRIAPGSGQDTIFIERNGRRFEYILDYMRDGKVSLPESIPKEMLLLDMKYLGFKNIRQRNIKYHSESFDYIPRSVNDMKTFQHVRFHEITWDVTRIGTDLVIENNNHSVKKIESDGQLQATYGIKGFSSGIHYWNIEIIKTNGNHFMIGVSKGLATGGVSCQGQTNDDDNEGVSYFVSHDNTNNDPTYTAGDVIGTLLNMNHKTVTFFKNGVHIVGIYHLTYDLYYPCICLSAIGDEVVSRDIFSSDHHLSA